MGSETAADLHMLFFPYMAQGHMLPMVDIAKLFAARGATVTILTTPVNADLIRPTLASSESSVSLHVVPFPSVAAGLPEGCENRAHLPSESLRPNFYRALAMFRRPFDQALRDLRPDCVVADMFLPWTYAVAADRGIPRLLFDGTGFFNRCADYAFQKHRPLDSLPPGAASFVLPGLPHRIEMLVSQTLEHARTNGWPGAEEFESIDRERKEVDPKSYGVIVNSFYELEADYVDYFRKVIGRKAWHVGPVSLSNRSAADKLVRGGGGGHVSVDTDKSLQWLDRQEPGSVIFLCFGSATVFSGEQIRALAAGVEAAGHPFLWVVRGGGERWLPEGFERRVVEEGKGMVVSGWVQQLAILNHAAVGGFVTHCGWNSTTEAISAGLPMVTWPLFGDQFYNEKLLVEVVKVAVAVGSKVYSLSPDRPVVGAEAVEEAVERLMGKGEEAEERRRRARELAEKARKAVEEGGSSYADILNLIQELLEMKAKNAAAAPALTGTSLVE